MVEIKSTEKAEPVKKKYPHLGHRKRLREKFLRSGLDGFHDYEIVELLLTLGTPFKDCKQMAKEAIKKFHGLRGVLDAEPSELQEIHGIGDENYFGLKLFQEINQRLAKEQITKKEFFDSPKAVATYLQKLIGREKKEHFVILYLDTRNQLIVDKVSIGSLNETLVHPREVFKNAIKASAAQVIIAHNHPSGDLDPSKEDVELTRQLVGSGRLLDIHLLDHLIVSENDFYSLRSMDEKLFV